MRSPRFRIKTLLALVVAAALAFSFVRDRGVALFWAGSVALILLCLAIGLISLWQEFAGPRRG